MIYLAYITFILAGEPQIEVLGTVSNQKECYTVSVAEAIKRSAELKIPISVFKLGCGSFPLILPK